VWQRRQKMLSQQVTIGPALIKGVERTNTVMARPQQQDTVFLPRNPYAMEVDRSDRNCYNSGGFGHLVKHCRNRGTENRIGERRRLEYEGQRREEEGKGSSNLNGKGNLIVFN